MIVGLLLYIQASSFKACPVQNSDIRSFNSSLFSFSTKTIDHYYTQMGNSLRCCLACVLPCGALDLIRIVHLNGFVEELTGPITADEVLKANPNHVLTRPTSQGVVRRILVLSPDTELKRGSIYFLIPSSSVPENKKTSSKKNKIRKKISLTDLSSKCDDTPLAVVLSADVASSEKKSSRRDRRSCHSGIWRPHLESISED